QPVTTCHLGIGACSICSPSLKSGVILRRKEEDASSRGKLPASSLNMQSGAKGGSFRLPQLEAVALRVERPSKAALTVVFDPILHLLPCRTKLGQHCVKISHPVIHHEGGRAWPEVGRVGGEC